MDRETVVRTALGMLDEVGLEGLSLRRLAKQLNVQAPTLYWYFKSKQELLDEMAIAMMTPGTPAEAPSPGATWDEWLAWMARGMRRSILTYRDGALLAARSGPTDDQWNALEFIVSALVRSGFEPVDAMRGIGALTNFVIGTTLEEQQDDPVRPQVDSSRHPTLAAAVSEETNGEQRFEHGLRLLLAGMQAQLTTGTAAPSTVT